MTVQHRMELQDVAYLAALPAWAFSALSLTHPGYFQVADHAAMLAAAVFFGPVVLAMVRNLRWGRSVAILATVLGIAATVLIPALA